VVLVEVILLLGLGHLLRKIIQDQLPQVDQVVLVELRETRREEFHNQDLFGGDHIYRQDLVGMVVIMVNQIQQLLDNPMAVEEVEVLVHLMVDQVEQENQAHQEEL
jgi:hypothetical protein